MPSPPFDTVNPAAAVPTAVRQPDDACQSLTYDLVIVGGGIVGLTLALALADSGRRLAVIEAQTFAQAAARQRAYAFSLTSAAIFRGLGLWPQVAPHITHFRRVSLSDGEFPQRVVFTPADAGAEAVYYGAEHGVLMAALQAAVSTSETIHCWSPAQVQSVEYAADQARVQVQADDQLWTLNTPLVVAADGLRSQLRQQAGIGGFGWPYWQSCITAILKPARPHGNIAYERFWPSGPFAILPLPGNRCQIVWTAPHQEAQALIALPPEQFMVELQRRYGDQMGALTLVNHPLLFPVQLMQSHRYGLPRLALVGDAAHCCHPVGGQGLNMGIRDAAALAEVLLAAQATGEDWGSLAVLRRYERWRRRENWLILGFTDLLNRGFSNRCWPMVLLRRLGILALRQGVFLRRAALRLMVGRFGRVPHLAKRGTPG